MGLKTVYLDAGVVNTPSEEKILMIRKFIKEDSSMVSDGWELEGVFENKKELDLYVVSIMHSKLPSPDCDFTSFLEGVGTLSVNYPSSLQILDNYKFQFGATSAHSLIYDKFISEDLFGGFPYSFSEVSNSPSDIENFRGKFVSHVKKCLANSDKGDLEYSPNFAVSIDDASKRAYDVANSASKEDRERMEATLSLVLKYADIPLKKAIKEKDFGEDVGKSFPLLGISGADILYRLHNHNILTVSNVSSSQIASIFSTPEQINTLVSPYLGESLMYSIYSSFPRLLKEAFNDNGVLTLLNKTREGLDKELNTTQSEVSKGVLKALYSSCDNIINLFSEGFYNGENIHQEVLKWYDEKLLYEKMEVKREFFYTWNSLHTSAWYNTTSKKLPSVVNVLLRYKEIMDEYGIDFVFLDDLKPLESHLDSDIKPSTSNSLVTCEKKQVIKNKEAVVECATVLFDAFKDRSYTSIGASSSDSVDACLLEEYQNNNFSRVKEVGKKIPFISDETLSYWTENLPRFAKMIEYDIVRHKAEPPVSSSESITDLVAEIKKSKSNNSSRVSKGKSL